MNFSLHARTSIAAAVLAAACVSAQARPQATDDIGPAEAGDCQIESWVDGDDDARTYVLGGACIVAENLELGIDLSRSRPQDGTEADVGLGLKWGPKAGAFDTAWGALQLGLKLSLGHTRPTDGDWKASGAGLAALASLELTPGLALHVNLGPQRDRQADLTSTLLSAALVWSPIDRAMLYAEVQSNDRRDLNGGSLRGIGARWWVIQDVLGLDLGVSRVAGAGSGSQWAVGVGWYGLRW